MFTKFYNHGFPLFTQENLVSVLNRCSIKSSCFQSKFTVISYVIIVL